MTGGLRVGVAVNDALLTGDPMRRRALVDRIAGGGLDHVTVGDHIDFHGGTGFDGIVAAATTLASHDRLSVVLGVYLAALRHPLATARAVSTLAQVAPGRVVLGVGVGGEDRREVANMGVDPATRGRRMDETLEILRRLGTGESVEHHGRFFDLDAARILPAPDPAVPIVIGGGGDAAVRRTVSYGDGWLAMWCSARRFAATWQQILEESAGAGRAAPTFAGLNVWCGFGPDVTAGRAALERHLTELYRIPGDKFRHLTAAGTPADVAAFIEPYVDGGARTVTLIPVAGDVDHAVDGAAAVRELLVAAGTGGPTERPNTAEV